MGSNDFFGLFAQLQRDPLLICRRLQQHCGGSGPFFRGASLRLFRQPLHDFPKIGQRQQIDGGAEEAFMPPIVVYIQQFLQNSRFFVQFSPISVLPDFTKPLQILLPIAVS